LVRTVYWLYWDANLKRVEQPSKPDAKVALYTDSEKQGKDEKDKNEDAFFIRMSMNVEHDMTMANSKAFLKNPEDAMGAISAKVEVELF